MFHRCLQKSFSMYVYIWFLFDYSSIEGDSHQILRGVMDSMPACHAADPGSSPARGGYYLKNIHFNFPNPNFYHYIFSYILI